MTSVMAVRDGFGVKFREQFLDILNLDSIHRGTKESDAENQK